jgi:antitoxin VapB
MALNITDPRTEQLAHELVAETGESLTQAVTVALRERLAAVRGRKDVLRAHATVARIQAAVAALPDLDPRSADELLGYDERGLPG